MGRYEYDRQSVKFTLPSRTLFKTSTGRGRDNHTLIVLACRLLVCAVYTMHTIVNTVSLL